MVSPASLPSLIKPQLTPTNRWHLRPDVYEGEDET
jgi:hypothetical protein